MKESRICVHQKWEELPNFSIDRRNINLYDSREILIHITRFIRNYQSGIDQTNLIVDSFLVDVAPTNDPKVCIVWNNESNQIRFVVTGMSLWRACIACENAINYFNVLLIDKEYMNED